MSTKGEHLPVGLSIRAHVVVEAAQDGRPGDKLGPSLTKTRCCWPLPGVRSSPCVCGRDPLYLQPQFHTRAKTGQLPLQHPLPSRHRHEHLQVTV